MLHCARVIAAAEHSCPTVFRSDARGGGHLLHGFTLVDLAPAIQLALFVDGTRVIGAAAHVGWTETQACRMAGALCVTELPAEMARAQESCAPGASTSYPDSCLHQAECVRLVKVGELVIEQTLESRASCLWSSEDVAECSCTGVAYSGASFSVSPFVSDDSCSAATSLCNDGIDTGSLGAIECTLDVEYSSRSEAWCDEVYQCAQPAAIAGRALQFGAQLASHCYRLEPDDPWECSCWSEHTTFVDAPDLTAACQANLGRCLEIKGGDIVNW